MADNITIIPEGAKVEGKLFSPGSINIDGQVTGDISCKGTLTLGKEAKVESNVETRDAVISGNFKGKMNSSGKIEIKATGRFIGDLIQKKPLLIIEKGALFKGNSINQDAKNVNHNSEGKY